MINGNCFRGEMKQLLYFLIGFIISLTVGSHYANACTDISVFTTINSGSEHSDGYAGYTEAANAAGAFRDSLGSEYTKGIGQNTETTSSGTLSYYFVMYRLSDPGTDPYTFKYFTYGMDICDNGPPDSDGDGIPDVNDPDSPDYDPYHNDSDFDSDGIVNGSDPDVDGDGIPDVEDPDIWGGDDGTGGDGTGGDGTGGDDYYGILSSIDGKLSGIKTNTGETARNTDQIKTGIDTSNNKLSGIETNTGQIKTGIDTSNNKLSGIETNTGQIKTGIDASNQNLQVISDHLGLSNTHLSDVITAVGDIDTNPVVNLTTPTANEIGDSVEASLIDPNKTIDKTITDNILDLDETDSLSAINIKYSERYNLFITTLKESDLFSLPFGVFNGPSGMGNSVQTVNIGKWGSSGEQTAAIDYSDYDNIWDILRAVFLLLTSFSCFKILVLKKG